MKVTGIQEREGYVEVRVEGPFIAERIDDLFRAAVEASTRTGGERVLLNVSEVTGKLPSTLDRYQLGMAGGRLPKGLRLAALARPEFIDPEKFGVRVARNRGAVVEVFDDPREALAWLLSVEPPAPGAK